MKPFSRLIAALLCTCASLNAQESPSDANTPVFEQSGAGHITVMNRILAKVNGKAISAMDVVRQMDMIFYREYPQYRETPEARFQFYMSSWKPVLQELINKELILADAEAAKFEVKNGDVRQELEEVFGPHLMANLDRAGLSYEDAWRMTKEELLLQRMVSARVRSKASMEVCPKLQREAYEAFSKKKLQEGEWRYQVVTVRDPDTERAAIVAATAHKLLSTGVCDLQGLQDCLEEHKVMGLESKVSISSEFSRTDKDISNSHRELLEGIATGEFSRPCEQTSRVGNSKVQRLGLLLERQEGEVPKFNEALPQLQSALMQTAMIKEQQRYYEFLRKQYAVEELIGVAAGDDRPPFVFQARSSAG